MFFIWNSRQLGEVSKRDWEHRRIFKDSWTISDSSSIEIEDKKRKFEGSRNYLGPIPIEIEGKKGILKDLEAISDLFLPRVSTWTFYMIMFFHPAASGDMVCSRSCIKVYTILYCACVVDLSCVDGVILVFYIVSLQDFSVFRIVLRSVNNLLVFYIFF